MKPGRIQPPGRQGRQKTKPEQHSENPFAVFLASLASWRPTFLVFLSGCGWFTASSQPSGPQGYTANGAPNVRIVKRDEIAGDRFDLRIVEQSFASGTDGTALVDAMLRALDREGARYVTGLEISVKTKRGDAWEGCRTYVAPKGTVHEALVMQPVFRPPQTVSVLKPVTRVVSESEYRCHMVSKPVQRMETTYEYRYDSISKRSVSQPVTRYVTRYELQNECRSEMVTRTVTRYEYQLEQRYVPPTWQTFVQRYTAYELTETEPLCEEVSAPLSIATPHLLRAWAHFPTQQ